jgi:hypothetical protein
MKHRFSLVVIMFLMGTLAQAQTARFGFSAGATLGSQSTKASGITINSDSKAGFTIGVMSDVSISESFSFQPGLNFTQKGGKFDLSDFGIPGASGDATYNLNYVEVPLNVVFKANAGNGKFFFGAGPSLGFGVSGKLKAGSDEEDVNFGSDSQDDLKPFDFGGNVLAGYELSNGLFFALNYNTTLNNLSTENDITTRNRYFGIRIGYLLGGKK